MTGSAIGRALQAVPATIGAAGVGILVTGVSGDGRAGALTLLALLVVVAARAASTGVSVDARAGRVTVRSFWRTHHLDASALRRVDTQLPHGRVPAVRFVLRDGREVDASAVSFLAGSAARRLVEDLTGLAVTASFELALTPTSFRRAV